MIHTTLVPVQREWQGWQKTEVALCDLQDIHWLCPSGAPRPLLHAYVAVSKFPLTASSTGTSINTERLRVCVLKSQTTPTVYAHLARQADDAARVEFCGTGT